MVFPDAFLIVIFILYFESSCTQLIRSERNKLIKLVVFYFLGLAGSVLAKEGRLSNVSDFVSGAFKVLSWLKLNVVWLWEIY